MKGAFVQLKTQQLPTIAPRADCEGLLIERLPSPLGRESKELSFVARDELNPSVDRQVLNAAVPVKNGGDLLPRRSDHAKQPDRVVLIADAVVDRFPGQTGSQVAPVAGESAETTDHVVNRLASAAEMAGVDRRGVVLEIDPAADDHGRCQNRFKYFAIGVAAVIVAVQKRSPAQVDRLREAARRNDERRVSRQPPFGPQFGPIQRTSEWIARMFSGEHWQPLAPRKVGSCVGRLPEFFEVVPMGWGDEVQVEEADFIGCRIVDAGKKVDVGRQLDSFFEQPRADFGGVEQLRGKPRIGLA